MPFKDPAKRREYHRKYHREVWYPANKPKHIARVVKNKTRARKELYSRIAKLKLSCIKCGEHRLATLDFHHLDPTQKDQSISNMVRDGRTWDSILEKIKKCEVLCSNCHRVLHSSL